MNCAQVNKELSDYSAGFLGGERRQRVQAHLRGCESCCRLMRELQAADRLLTADRVETGEAFVGRVMDEVRETEALRKWLRTSLLENLGPTVAGVSISTLLLLALQQQAAEWAKLAKQLEGSWNLVQQPEARLLLFGLIVGAAAWLTNWIAEALTSDGAWFSVEESKPLRPASDNCDSPSQSRT